MTTKQHKTPELTYGDVWKTLSKINVSEHTAAKGGFNYLAWTWAWQTLMEHYPQARLEFREERDEATHTVMVYCTLAIDSLYRTMWLPVMDHKNKAVVNPDTRAISDARQRAWVKTAALFGLGLHIYQGEGIPDALLKEEATPEELAKITGLLEQLGAEAQPLVNWIGTGMQPGIKVLSELRSINADPVIAKLEGQLERKAAQDKAVAASKVAEASSEKEKAHA